MPGRKGEILCCSLSSILCAMSILYFYNIDVPINDSTIVVRDIINQVCYTIHQSCYNSVIFSGNDILHAEALPKLVTVNGILNLAHNRKPMPAFTLEVFPVFEIRSDISMIVFGCVILNSYGCFSGEKTVLIEQNYSNIAYKIPFTRARFNCKCLQSKIENIIDLFELYSNNGGNLITAVMQNMDIHMFITMKVIKNADDIRSQFYSLIISKISIEITQTKLASYITPATSTKIYNPMEADITTHFSHTFDNYEKQRIPSFREINKAGKAKVDNKNVKKSDAFDCDFNNLEAYPIEYYMGKIVILAKSRQGSKYLQGVLQYCTKEIIALMSKEIENEFHSLLTHHYGNYFCQKLIPYLSSLAKADLLKNVRLILDHLTFY